MNKLPLDVENIIINYKFQLETHYIYKKVINDINNINYKIDIKYFSHFNHSIIKIKKRRIYYLGDNKLLFHSSTGSKYNSM